MTHKQKNTEHPVLKKKLQTLKITRLIIICLIILITLNSWQLSAAEKKTDDSSNIRSSHTYRNAYRICSGDILEITTWKEPDLSREEVLVRTDGKISFPLLNDVQAAGLTPLEMKKNMETGLTKFISAPSVTVAVRTPESYKIYVLGEVLNTGEYPLTKNLTVIQAFAIAGGFTEWASKKEIILMRKEGGEEKIYRINYQNIIKGEDLSQNLMLEADDTIIVP